MRLFFYFLWFALFVGSANAQISVIVSENSAAEFAAAQRFHQQYPAVLISARTPAQLAELNDVDLNKWLAQGRLLFGVGLFGPAVERLRASLPNFRGERFIIHSDLELVSMSNMGGASIFADRAGDRDLTDAICTQLAQRQIDCITMLPDWGKGSVQAVEWIKQPRKMPLLAIVNLQDFVVGGLCACMTSGCLRSFDTVSNTVTKMLVVDDHELPANLE